MKIIAGIKVFMASIAKLPSVYLKDKCFRHRNLETNQENDKHRNLIKAQAKDKSRIKILLLIISHKNLVKGIRPI